MTPSFGTIKEIFVADSSVFYFDGKNNIS